MNSNHPIPRIALVSTRPGSILDVTWQDGTADNVNLSGWIAMGQETLSPLTVPKVFGRAQVADYGLSVQWGDDEDLSIDSLHLAMLAEQQRPFIGRDLLEWQKKVGLSNQEAAEFLGISPSTWHNYKNSIRSLPTAIQIACRASERDSVLFEAHYRPRRAGRPSGDMTWADLVR